jgi:drug/metabolite transporter (DMT)-like permease
MTVNEQIASRWMERMPLRWALGGLLLGIIWSAISGYLQGNFKNPVGGVEAGFVRLIVIIVLPLALLGLIWGYSERAKLVRSANQSSAILSEAIRRTVRR